GRTEGPLATEDRREVVEPASQAGAGVEGPGDAAHRFLDDGRHGTAAAALDSKGRRGDEPTLAGLEADRLVSEDVPAGVEARPEPADGRVAPAAGVDPPQVDPSAQVGVGVRPTLRSAPIPVGTVVVRVVVAAVVADRAPADPRRGVGPVDPGRGVADAGGPV